MQNAKYTLKFLLKQGQSCPTSAAQKIKKLSETPVTVHNIAKSGLHKLWYPGIRDTSTWSKFGAQGEHGDVFLFSNLGAL